jgi:hypothetical protein
MNRLKSSILAVCAVAVMAVGTITLLPTASVSAQGSAALSITPRKDYSMEPGKVINDTILVRNLDRERPLYLSLRVVDFSSNGLDGTPKLMLDENEPETEWSLRSILEVPKDVTVEPGQSKSVDIKLNVPKNQGPGSYYSAIVFSSGASEGGNVGLSASGVSLVFAEMPGKVDEKLVLEKIGHYDSVAKKYKLFSMNMPMRIGYTVRNEGNVTGRPFGTINIKNIFGQEKTINNINPNKSLALIGQTRIFEDCILLAKEQVEFDGDRQEAATCASPGLWPGFYTVELTGLYGRNGNQQHEIYGKGHFFYTPWWFVITLILAALFVGYHIWRFVRFIRGGKTGGKKHTFRRKK